MLTDAALGRLSGRQRLAEFWRRWVVRATMPGVAEPKQLWTIPDVARCLGVTPEAVAGRVRRGSMSPHYSASYGRGVAHLFDPHRLMSEVTDREARLIHKELLAEGR